MQKIYLIRIRYFLLSSAMTSTTFEARMKTKQSILLFIHTFISISKSVDQLSKNYRGHTILEGYRNNYLLILNKQFRSKIVISNTRYIFGNKANYDYESWINIRIENISGASIFQVVGVFICKTFDSIVHVSRFCSFF